jgi:hypothetical protein
MEFADAELIAEGGRSVHATSAAPIEAIVTTAKSFRIPVPRRFPSHAGAQA